MYKLQVVFDRSGFIFFMNSSLCMDFRHGLQCIHDTEACPLESSKNLRAAGLLMLTVLLSYTLYSIILRLDADIKRFKFLRRPV